MKKQNVKDEKIIKISDSEFAVSFFTFSLEIGISSTSITFNRSLFLDGVIHGIQELGYGKRALSEKDFMFINVQGNIISEVSAANIKDHFYDYYLRNRTTPLSFVHHGIKVNILAEELRETFLYQSHSLFTEKFLLHLETHSVPDLRDSKNASFFPYINYVAKVNANGIETINYDDINDCCIWKDHIIQRPLKLTTSFKDGHFPKFIENVAGENKKKTEAFYSAIGYMLNNHNHPSKGQAVICYDEVPSEAGNPMGGTGKGLFCNALKQMRNILKVDGKKIRQDDRFRFQGVTTRTQVFWLDDVHRDFPFEVLHSVSTDGWSIERKFKDEFFIEPEKGPKIILCSNTILSGSGTTNKRRQFILEFSDFYSSLISTGAEEPIKETHGAIFFDNDYWDDQEWAKFDSFMLHCSLFYHREGLKPYTQVGKEKSRLVQSTCNDFSEWADEKLKANKDEFDSKNMFDDYKRETGDDIIQREFNRWISIYAEFNGWQLKKRKSNGRTLMKLDD